MLIRIYHCTLLKVKILQQVLVSAAGVVASSDVSVEVAVTVQDNFVQRLLQLVVKVTVRSPVVVTESGPVLPVNLFTI